MKRRLFIALLAATSLIGCTTMRPIDASETDLATELEPHDHLVIYESSGRIIDMTYIGMDGDRVRGRLTDGSEAPISVAVPEIEKLEIEKIDGAKTTLAVVGGTVIVVPLAIIAGLAGLMGAQ